MRSRSTSLFAIVAIVLTAPGTGLLSSGPAHAQSLGLWGGWNEYGHGWQGSRPQRSTPQFSPFEPFADEPAQPAFPRIMSGGGRPIIEPKAPPVVVLPNAEVPGTVLIDTKERKLYLTLDAGTAYAYPISVGREGFTWTGSETISRIAEWPDWHPPKEMLARDPRLPEKMHGGLKNPLGAVALYLGNTLYRIHGTNDPKTIGMAASSGCFRMLNSHAVHLASLVSVGTTVKVMPSLPEPETVADAPWKVEPAALGMSNPQQDDAY